MDESIGDAGSQGFFLFFLFPPFFLLPPRDTMGYGLKGPFTLPV